MQWFIVRQTISFSWALLFFSNLVFNVKRNWEKLSFRSVGREEESWEKTRAVGLKLDCVSS